METQDPPDDNSNLDASYADAGDSFDKAPLAPIERVLECCLLGGNVNPLDLIDGDELDENLAVPSTTAGEEAYTCLLRDEDEEEERNGGMFFPMHVLFNQAASLCTRFNKCISGTQSQQNFVQKVVSSIRGYSTNLLYFMSSIFPGNSDSV